MDEEVREMFESTTGAIGALETQVQVLLATLVGSGLDAERVRIVLGGVARPELPSGALVAYNAGMLGFRRILAAVSPPTAGK